MAKNTTSANPVPDTAWLARGRHLGPEPERDVRRNLIALKAAGVVDDFLELEPAEAARSTVLHPRDESADPGPSARRVFEARWQPTEGITVRGQLTTYDPGGRRKSDDAVSWTLVAEAERAWDLEWASPATVFWPDTETVLWDHDATGDVWLRAANMLPEDDDELRRHLRDCARDSWFLHVVVHEAMTPDAVGQWTLTRFLPPGLRHRVVEHRASPQQAQIADFAVKREFDVRLPRGGAVVLPVVPGQQGYEAERFTLRSVFLDGSEPVELTSAIKELAALPRPLGPEAEAALTRLRQGWHLLTPDEELVHAQQMVSRYAEALDAMTKSRDLYKDAADAAQAALAEAGGGDAAPAAPLPGGSERPDASPLGGLTKAFGKLWGPGSK
ncbi:hypothetical protein ABT160_16365 [Streptomyces sp. NPDC001941]|uniref:hypothetical protein n=1 Tax=Streptomyces sp. NPDC001941 TaxID=3154659 RepID=UPI003320C9A7